MSQRHHLLAAISLVALAGCQFLSPSAPAPDTTSASPSASSSPTSVASTDPTATESVRPTHTYLYVFNGLGKTIDEIDTKTRAVTLSTGTTGLYPNQFVTYGATTYLVNSGDSNIVSYDLRAHSVLGTFNLPAGLNPFALAFATPSNAVVMSAWGNFTGVTWVNLATKQQVATASVPNLAWTYSGAAIANNKAYVPCTEGNWGEPTSYSALKVYDMTSHALLRTIDLDATANPHDIVLDPNGKLEVGTDDGVIVVDPATDQVTRTISLGCKVYLIQFASGSKAYGETDGGLVSFNPSTGAVLRNDANKIVVPAGAPGAFRIIGNAAYVANFASDSIRVIDLTTETASGSDLAVGDGPQDMASITVYE